MRDSPIEVNMFDRMLYEYTGADTAAECDTDEDVRQCGTGTDRRQRGGADVLADDNRVGHVVDLLEKAAENHRQREDRERAKRRVCDEVFVFCSHSHDRSF